MPIFTKRLVPKALERENFWIPSASKTQPTRMRTSRMPKERRDEESCGSIGIVNLEAIMAP